MSVLLRQLLLIIGISILASNVLAALPSSSDKHAVAVHYTDMAYAIYSDAEKSGIALQSSVNTFLKAPDQKSLIAAQNAWKTARKAYQQSEVFRFGNPVVDDWEGQLNNWPLDEGLIDYVADDYFYALGNIGADLNIIANPNLNLGSDVVDASTINAELLRSLHELGGSAANVTTGYHAIEFLLWGQDLNGHKLGAGERPYSDYLRRQMHTRQLRPACRLSSRSNRSFSGRPTIHEQAVGAQTKRQLSRRTTWHERRYYFGADVLRYRFFVTW